MLFLKQEKNLKFTQNKTAKVQTRLDKGRRTERGGEGKTPEKGNKCLVSPYWGSFPPCRGWDPMWFFPLCRLLSPGQLCGPENLHSCTRLWSAHTWGSLSVDNAPYQNPITTLLQFLTTRVLPKNNFSLLPPSMRCNRSQAIVQD